MQKVLAYVRDLAALGQSPTLRQVADYMNWKSTATAAEILRSLQKAKLIKRKKFARTIKVPGPDRT